MRLRRDVGSLWLWWIFLDNLRSRIIKLMILVTWVEQQTATHLQDWPTTSIINKNAKSTMRVHNKQHESVTILKYPKKPSGAAMVPRCPNTGHNFRSTGLPFDQVSARHSSGWKTTAGCQCARSHVSWVHANGGKRHRQQ